MTKSNTNEIGLKPKIVHELRRLLGISIYLTMFFFVFKLYTRLVLAEYDIDYVEYGLTALKALVLAKVVLTMELLQLGERFRERPLIIPTFYSTLVFALFAWAFEIVQHFVVGLLRGQGFSAVLAELSDKGWPYLAGMTLVVFVAFLPFFAFSETERVLGEGTLRDLFLKPRK